MFTKLLVIATIAALAAAKPAEYPPGVDPAACPNYPFCHVEYKAVPRFNPDGSPVPEWVYNPSILPVGPLGRVPTGNYPIPPTYVYAGAARYPADFNPALCPNYPYCR